MSQGCLYLSAADEIVALADENIQEPITRGREHHKPRPPSSIEHIYSKKTRGQSEIDVDEVGLFSPHHWEVFSRFMYRFFSMLASFLQPSLSFACSVLYACALRPTFVLSRDARRADEVCNAVQRGLPSLLIFLFSSSRRRFGRFLLELDVVACLLRRGAQSRPSVSRAIEEVETGSASEAFVARRSFFPPVSVHQPSAASMGSSSSNSSLTSSDEVRDYTRHFVGSLLTARVFLRIISLSRLRR